MKISPNQNTITRDDGTVLVAVEVADFYSDETPSCDGCILMMKIMESA